jgi:hypothetical protein
METKSTALERLTGAIEGPLIVSHGRRVRYKTESVESRERFVRGRCVHISARAGWLHANLTWPCIVRTCLPDNGRVLCLAQITDVPTSIHRENIGLFCRNARHIFIFWRLVTKIFDPLTALRRSFIILTSPLSGLELVAYTQQTEHEYLPKESSQKQPAKATLNRINPHHVQHLGG